MKWSGESGHACEDQQHKHPYMIDGHLLKLNMRRPINELQYEPNVGGTVVGTPSAGVSGTVFSLTPVPNPTYKFSAYSANGTELTGNSGTFHNSDVTAGGIFYYSPTFVPTGTLTNPACYELLDPPTPNSTPNVPLTGTFGPGDSTYSVDAGAGDVINIVPCETYGPFGSQTRKPVEGIVALKRTPNYCSPGLQSGFCVGIQPFNFPFQYSSYYDGKLVHTQTITTADISNIYYHAPGEIMKIINVAPFSADYLEVKPGAYFTVKAEKPWTFFNSYVKISQAIAWYGQCGLLTGRLE
jgi:hypothetical protein